MDYRREIDGLRAIAVLPVILFHSGLSLFAGGFIGVDVFFVVSGYLITSIILQEKNNFSLLKFYERRARRILPALFVVLLMTSIAAWFFLLPIDMRDFSQSLSSVSLFSSNILFWKKSGYFDLASELKPLLHTWSLAIEEQFYLFFPLLLVFFTKKNRSGLFLSLCLISVVSFLAAQWLSTKMPSEAFYLLPTRAWELLLGAIAANILAYKKSYIENLPHWLKDLGGSFGVLLLFGSIFIYDKSTPFPSFYALAPTLGTFLIILLAQEQTRTAKFLGNRFLVGIGLVSYSAYLWHQPILAFVKYRYASPLRIEIALIAFFFTFLFAYFSWRFVEKPFRDKAFISRRGIFAFATLGSIVFLIVGLAGHITDGFPLRRAPNYLPEKYFYYSLMKKKELYGIDGNLCVSENASICELNRNRESRENILLVGDSHSADYIDEYRNYLKNYHFNGSQMSIGGCAFLKSQNQFECNKAKNLLEKLIVEKRFSKMIIIGNYYDHMNSFAEIKMREEIDSIIGLIIKMLKADIEVVFFMPRYRLTANPPHAALGKFLEGVHVFPSGVSIALWDEALDQLKVNKHFKIFNQRDELIKSGCSHINCFNGHTSEKYPLYRDISHLTDYGAHIIFEKYLNFQSVSYKN